MANEKILVVDDDTNICELLRLYLTKEGYQVTTANDGEEGLEKFNQLKPDMVLLDVMMPRMDGLEVCRRIRKLGNTPVMMLTAKGETFDKVLGLELGADDYLAKPFGIRELIARTRALLRRSQATNSTSAEVSASGIALDDDAHTATGEHGPIDLTPREFELMSCLMHNAGKVVSREDLLREAWGWEFITETKTVDTHIKRLRDKIEAAGYNPQVVETVRGYGYRFKK